MKLPDKRGKDNVKEFFSGLRVICETGINLDELSLTENEMNSSTYFTQCIKVLAEKTAYFLTYFVTDLGTPMNGKKINKRYVRKRTQFIKKAWNPLSKAREEATVFFNLAITVLLLELSDKTKSTTTTTSTLTTSTLTTSTLTTSTSTTPTPEESENSLVKFRDSVRATIQFIPPHNKKTLITTIATRYENDGRYLKLSTGGAMNEYTSNRVNIYEEETGGQLQYVPNRENRVTVYNHPASKTTGKTTSIVNVVNVVNIDNATTAAPEDDNAVKDDNVDNATTAAPEDDNAVKDDNVDDATTAVPEDDNAVNVDNVDDATTFLPDAVCTTSTLFSGPDSVSARAVRHALPVFARAPTFGRAYDVPVTVHWKKRKIASAVNTPRKLTKRDEA